MANNTVLLPNNISQQIRWLVISQRCLLLSTPEKQVTEEEHGPSKLWFKQAIVDFNKNAADNCNFKVIENDDNLVSRVLNILPVIIDHALKLNALIGNVPIQILKIGESKKVTLSRSLICSLLATGFLSAFPRGNDEQYKNLPYFNFWRLFNHQNDAKTAVKREKIKCLLEYFEQMGTTGNGIPETDVTFERRCIIIPTSWEISTEKLHILCVVCGGKIEDAKGMLQVDFANKYIGGGVIADGAIKEEIRFLICPELLVSRLFTERLDENEVMIITGSVQFSDYTGYRQDFKFKKLPVEMDKQGNILPRTEAQVVAMDAKNFSPTLMREQYKKTNIDRELHKSFVGFSPGRQGVKTPPIATGNWGCGAFNGDSQLKFIIQWMAASQNQRSVQYSARDEFQKKELEWMAKYLVSRKVTVGQLYQVLIHYDSDIIDNILPGLRNVPKSVFQYLVDNIK